MEPGSRSVVVASYVEITNPVHGGPGWEFGTCLWSPQQNKAGGKSWELMREVEPGDTIFHLLKDRKGEGYFLAGVSRAAAPAATVTTQPPEADRWAGMSPYFRISVEAFHPLPTPVNVDELLAAHRELLEEELRRNPKGQFFELKQKGHLQVSLKYIARAQDRVEQLLLDIVTKQGISPAKNTGDTFVPSDAAPAYPDYTPPGSVQATVIRRVRDTKMSLQVKSTFNFKCAICGYSIRLPEGRRYAEAHHLVPLGAGHLGPDTADNLLVLCPSHHAEFDYGSIAIDPSNMTIITLADDHPHRGKRIAYELVQVNRDFLAYHLNKIFRRTG